VAQSKEIKYNSFDNKKKQSKKKPNNTHYDTFANGPPKIR